MAPPDTYPHTHTHCLRPAAGIQCQQPVPLPPGSSNGDGDSDACVHYRELAVKDNGAGGTTARLAVRLLRWVEGAPMVREEGLVHIFDETGGG